MYKYACFLYGTNVAFFQTVLTFFFLQEIQDTFLLKYKQPASINIALLLDIQCVLCKYEVCSVGKLGGWSSGLNLLKYFSVPYAYLWMVLYDTYSAAYLYIL